MVPAMAKGVISFTIVGDYSNTVITSTYMFIQKLNMTDVNMKWKLGGWKVYESCRQTREICTL
jgi:hypothetical protein